MSDAAGATQALQSAQPSKPPQERPTNMRDTFSILETGEVVAIGVARTGRGASAQINAWVWVEKGKRWALAEQEYGPEIAQQLGAGMERYEEVLRKDPKQAALLRQRSDNTVDGKPNPPASQAAAEQAPPAPGEGGSQAARIEDPVDVPNLLGAGQ